METVLSSVVAVQVVYACREYACTAIDVLARRLRLAFLNVHAAEEALPRVVEIMARELRWSAQKQKASIIYCTALLSLSVCVFVCLSPSSSTLLMILRTQPLASPEESTRPQLVHDSTQSFA